jgi:hypothetical protein
VTIDGVEYVRRDATEPSQIRIVILHRGWVVVGRYSDDGATATIANASVVRIWGTTKGLGEIATGGPTSKTVLDPCGTVRVSVNAIIATLDCEVTKWTSKVA